MAVAYQSFVQTKTASNVTTVNILSTGFSSGDLMVAIITTDGNRSGSLAPDEAGWTQQQLDTSAAGDATIGIWYRHLSAAPAASYNFSWTGGQHVIGTLVRITGHNTSSPVDVMASGQGTSATPTCPTATTTVADTLVMRIECADSNDLATEDAGYPASHTGRYHRRTGAGTGNVDTTTQGLATTPQAAIGATGTAAFTLDASEQWRCTTLVIAPATTGRIMSSLAGSGGLAAAGGIAGKGGGLAAAPEMRMTA